MEVSPYPCAAKMEDYLGYCTVGSAADKLPPYNFYDEGLELWKLALHSFPPYGIPGMAPGIPADAAQLPYTISAPEAHLEHAWPAPEQAHVFFMGVAPPYNYSVVGDRTFPLFNVHGKGGGGYEQLISRRPGKPPHEAFFLVLQYVGLEELLSLELVCKSLQGWIRSDTSLWRDIRVEQPLSGKLTDEALTRLCSRAQGYLRSLALVDCMLISNDALHEVLVTNLMLSKLHLLWRSRVSADGLVKVIQQHNEIGGMRLRQLWIRGLHLRMSREELRELREAVVSEPRSSVRPQLYDSCGELSACRDDERSMDVEACPRCLNPRVVYDCSRQKCREKQQQECRACISCIARCRGCGTCLTEVKFRECFNMELICYECSSSGGGDCGAFTGMMRSACGDDSFGRKNNRGAAMAAAAAGRG